MGIVRACICYDAHTNLHGTNFYRISTFCRNRLRLIVMLFIHPSSSPDRDHHLLLLLHIIGNSMRSTQLFVCRADLKERRKGFLSFFDVRDLSDKQGSEERRNEWPRLSDRDRDRIYLGYGHSKTRAMIDGRTL